MKSSAEKNFKDEFEQLAAQNNLWQLVELCERTLGLNAVDARRVYRKVLHPICLIASMQRHLSNVDM